MRILVTGGTGFLGSRLIDEFCARGHETMNFDRHADPIFELTAPDRMLYSVKALDGRPNLVVHAAGCPGRRFCEDDPEKAWRDNVIATTEVAQTCRRLKIPLVHFSTSEVYGISCDRGPVNEHSPLEPRNTYAHTNVAAEIIVRHYLGDQVTIVRPTMPYGPGMEVGYGRAALPTFIANALAKKRSDAHEGTARSWCYIDDTIRALADIAELADGRTYNVGRDDELFDTYDLALTVYRILHADTTLVDPWATPDSTITREKDISCARLSDLGWTPRVSLHEGISRTADWLRERQES